MCMRAVASDTRSDSRSRKNSSLHSGDVSRIADLRRDKNGRYLLRTNDGNEYPVGRTYKDNLKLIAQSWRGIELP